MYMEFVFGDHGRHVGQCPSKVLVQVWGENEVNRSLKGIHDYGQANM